MEQTKRSMMNKWASIVALVGAATAVAAPAHQHGQAQLEIALEGDRLSILLASPLDALVGFERAPRTESERQALASMGEALRDAGAMFALPEAAHCALLGVELDSPVLAQQPVKGGHADLLAHYRFRCTHSHTLHGIRTGLFEAFPRLRKLNLQFVGPAGQRAATLTPKNPRFAWLP